MGLYMKDGINKNVPRFLNRMLGMRLEVQDLLFTYFTSMLDAMVKVAKSVRLPSRDRSSLQLYGVADLVSLLGRAFTLTEAAAQLSAIRVEVEQRLADHVKVVFFLIFYGCSTGVGYNREYIPGCLIDMVPEELVHAVHQGQRRVFFAVDFPQMH